LTSVCSSVALCALDYSSVCASMDVQTLTRQCTQLLLNVGTGQGLPQIGISRYILICGLCRLEHVKGSKRASFSHALFFLSGFTVQLIYGLPLVSCG